MSTAKPLLSLTWLRIAGIPFEAEETVNIADRSLSRSAFYLFATPQPVPNIQVRTPAGHKGDRTVSWTSKGCSTLKQPLLAVVRTVFIKNWTFDFGLLNERFSHKSDSQNFPLTLDVVDGPRHISCPNFVSLFWHWSYGAHHANKQ